MGGAHEKHPSAPASEFPDDPEDVHSTGPELWEKKAGQKFADPFDWHITAEGPGEGTKVSPKIVPSIEESRIVGCVCEQEAMHIKWMTVYKGEPRRCQCGIWFKVVEADWAAYPEFPDLPH